MFYLFECWSGSMCREPKPNRKQLWLAFLPDHSVATTILPLGMIFGLNSSVVIHGYTVFPAKK